MPEIKNKEGAVTAGENVSYWIHSLNSSLSYNVLSENLETEVVIAGGGMAGLSIAYCLCRLGKRVVLLEDGNLGSGETGRTTAHLVTALDDRYYNLEKLYGQEEAGLIAQSHAHAIDFIESTIARESIDCDFERLDGYLFLHPSDKAENLLKEFEACQRAGLSVETVREVPGLKNSVTQAIKFKNQAQFNPLKYLKGLADAIVKLGGKIYTGTHVKDFDKDGITSVNGFTVKAKHIVVATNTPVNNRFVMHLKQYAYRTYAIGMLINKDSLPKALWWDTGNFETNDNIPPYHYIRTQPYDAVHDLLICGGEDHPTGLSSVDLIPEENRYGLLEDWCNKHFAEGKVIYHWSGQVLEPMDSLAYIGRNPADKSNVYIATGDSGNGMTHSAIAGMLITDLIEGKVNPWEKLYNPSRFKIFKAGNLFFKEIVGGFIAYLKDKPKDAQKVKLSEIKKGEGKIIEVDGKKFGAYADDNKRLHLVSAECTHLQCIVKWNNDEKSWDCPCHGSRFTYMGKVINGPANSNLDYIPEH